MVTCPPLTTPDNGDIDCSVGGDGEANPGDTCTFTCDDGYELGGSTSRTCGDDGSWSGNDTTCTIGMYTFCLLHHFMLMNYKPCKVFLSIKTIPQMKNKQRVCCS